MSAAKAIIARELIMFVLAYLCIIYTISSLLWSKLALAVVGQKVFTVALNEQNKVAFLSETGVALDIK